MSDQPGTSRPPLRAEPTPTKTATRRRARPIAIPSDETPRNEVTFLRPSEVPQRKPLPEYREPQPRKTVPKNVPLEDLHNYHREECLNVSIPHFINTEDLIKESQRVNGLISFRSTNFVDPSVILKEIKKKEEETVTLMDNDKNSIIDIVGDGINYEKLKKVEKSLCQIDIITEFMNRSRHLQGKKVNGCIMRIDETKQLLFHVIIDGPVGSIYEGGTFFADINIQPYQNHSLIPRVCFHTFIFHPNLGKYGNWDMRGIQWERRSNLEVLYNFIVEGMRNVKYDIERRNLAQLEDMSQPNISRLALNLLAISALFGVIACSGYGGDITYNNHNNFHVLHDRHHRSHHSRSNSRDSDEKWECRRLGVFNSPNPLTNPLLSAPKIAYFNRNGKEYAIAVCENPQIQILVGKSRGASPDFTQTRDYAVLSASSKSGLTFKCNRRHDRYEAVNLVTGSMARIEALACITVAQNDTAAVAIVNGIVGPLQAAGLHL